MCVFLCGMSVMKIESDREIHPLCLTIRTGKPLDLCVQGEGYFQVETQGQMHYTRHGRFFLNRKREVCWGVENSEIVLSPIINIPYEASKVFVMRDGTVGVQSSDEGTLTLAGCIQLAKFEDPSELQNHKNGLCRRKESATKQPHVQQPGYGSAGHIEQGFLETNLSPPGKRSTYLVMK